MIEDDWFLSLGCLVQISASSCWLDPLIIILCRSLCAQSLSHVWLFVTPMDCSPPGSFVHRDSPGKNTGVGCHALLQGIFKTQGSNLHLPHCRRILNHLNHWGSPYVPLYLWSFYLLWRLLIWYNTPTSTFLHFFVIYLFPCFQITYIIIFEVNSLWTDYICLCQFLSFNCCVKPSVFNDLLELVCHLIFLSSTFSFTYFMFLFFIFLSSYRLHEYMGIPLLFSHSVCGFCRYGIIYKHNLTTEVIILSLWVKYRKFISFYITSLPAPLRI